MTVYSYSRLGSYAQCPLKYKYNYVDGVKEKRRTVEAFMGSRFHDVMEHLYGRVPSNVPSAEDLAELFNRLWDEKWTDGIHIVRGDRSADDYRAAGLRAIHDYWQRYSPFDQGRTLGLERDLRADLDGTGRHRLRCIIDRLVRMPDGTFEIHDYKTSGFLPPQAALDEDEQLALYEIAVRQSWPDVAKVDLVWHYVAFDMEMRSCRTPQQLEELSAKTCARIDEVEAAAEFPPRESERCEWCEYQPICPLFSHRFRVERLSLEQYATDDAISLVNRYAALDEKRRELAEGIKRIESEQDAMRRQAIAKADEEGVSRLFGDTHVLTIREETKVSYPKKGELARAAFEEELKGRGLWGDVLDVSYHSIKAMAEKEGWAGPEGPPRGLGEYLNVVRQKQAKLSRRKDKNNDNTS